MKSIRKPHNQDAGYIAERKFHDSHIVIYNADEQGIDASNKYAVVCSEHGAICSASTLPKARELMKNPEFCAECVKADDWSLRNNPRLRTAVRLSRQTS